MLACCFPMQTLKLPVSFCFCSSVIFSVFNVTIVIRYCTLFYTVISDSCYVMNVHEMNTFGGLKG